MAKNWTMAEAAKVIATEGVVNENVMDFGKRFPVTTNLITAALAGSRDALIILLGMMPDYVTMGKLEKNFKESAETETEATADVEETEDEATEATETDEKDYSSMTNKELKAALRKAGFKSSEIKGKNKEAMLQMLNSGANVANLDAEDPAESEPEAEAEDTVDYSKMSAKELYKLCKSKGIDVEQKKPAKYYIDAINAAEAEVEEADDEWEDTAPAKKTKKEKSSKGKKEKATKAAKPAAKPAKAEEDEWDI